MRSLLALVAILALPLVSASSHAPPRAPHPVPASRALAPEPAPPRVPALDARRVPALDPTRIRPVPAAPAPVEARPRRSGRWAGVQAMGTGGIDVVLPASPTFQIGDPPPGGDGGMVQVDPPTLTIPAGPPADVTPTPADPSGRPADADDGFESILPYISEPTIEQLMGMTSTPRPPSDPDPFGSLDAYEGGDDEYIDDFAAMTPEERAARIRDFLATDETDPSIPEEEKATASSTTAAAPPAPAPGLKIVGGDGKPVDSVRLGEDFTIEMWVPVSQDPGGREIEITMTGEGGDTQDVTLTWDGEEPVNGLYRYRTPKAVSLAGESWNFDVPGTLDGLEDDLSLERGGSTVTVRTEGVGAGFGTFTVFGNAIEQGIFYGEATLGRVMDALVAELIVARRVLADPAIANDATVKASVQAWIDRTQAKIEFVRYVRERIARLTKPLDKLRYLRMYLGFLLVQRDDHSVIVESAPDMTRVYDSELNLSQALDQHYSEGLTSVYAAYAMGLYSTLAHVTMVGPLRQLITGRNEFDREASRGWALVELGIGVVALKLPGALVEWLAGGAKLSRVQINLPRFRSTPTRGNVTVPSRPGRLAAETAGGQLPSPTAIGGRPRGLSPEAVRFWQNKGTANVVPEARASRLQSVNDDIVRLDTAVARARQRGVPDEVVAGVLDDVRTNTLDEAIPIVEGRLEIEAALRNGERIFGAADDLPHLAGIATDVQIAHIDVIDVTVVRSVISKAHLESQGKPQTWTAEEIRYGRAIAARAARGEDLSTWKTPEVLELTHTNPTSGRVTVTGHEYQGLEPLFSSSGGDLDAIGTVFSGGGRGLRVSEPAPAAGAPPVVRTGGNRPVEPEGGTVIERRPVAPEGETVIGARTDAAAPGGARPLASLDEYRGLVARQEAGEILDLGNVARPGIARVTDDGIGVVQGAGRWENTRPDEFLDVFVPAGTRPPGVEVQVVQTGVPVEVVRTANLLSSRGQKGTNPVFIDIAVRNVPTWDRIRVRARDVKAPTSKVEFEIQTELGALRERGVDVGTLERAVAPLAPVDRLRVIRDPAARAEAIRTGAARTPVDDVTPIDPAVRPTSLGGPSGPGAADALEVVIRATGGSTGPVLEAFFLNHGKPVRIQTDGLVLEPLEPDAAQAARIAEILDAAAAGKPLPPKNGAAGGAGPAPDFLEGASVVRMVLDAYCLEKDLEVPTEGVFFRIAPAEAQAGNDRVRDILAASAALHWTDGFGPQRDPESYFHSVRQWSIWTAEQGYDEAGFVDAFVENTRGNAEARDVDWTSETEALVRDLAEDRWPHVTAVLEAAGAR